MPSTPVSRRQSTTRFSKRKVIRRQPLLERLRSYPFDVLLQLNELRLSIDWDPLATTVALPLGGILSFLLICCHFAYQRINDKDYDNGMFDESLVNGSDIFEDVKESFFSWLV